MKKWFIVWFLGIMIASGGLFGATTNVQIPARGAFYYAWFPQTWSVNASHVFYHPDLGYYRSDDQNVIDKHIDSLDYANMDFAIVSWWGPGTDESIRIPLILNRTTAKGSSLKWAVYYEQAGFPESRDTSVTGIRKNLDYLKSKYTSHAAYAKIDGKPVIFVYNIGETDVVAENWKLATAGEWYVVLKVYSGYRDVTDQPDSWHQYGPSTAAINDGDSYVISPGFWRADESTARLSRDLNRWSQNIRDMLASGKKWQLVTSFNEWGEGTAVESATEWSSASGYGKYLDALHYNGNSATAPAVSFAAPTTLTVKAGTNLYVKVNATDPDGISRVYLYKNGVQLARSEGGAPYEWCAPGQNDPELKNLQPGTFTLKAKAVDKVGTYTEKTITITVQAANQAPYFTVDPFSKPDATVGLAYNEPFSGKAVDPEGGTKTFSKVAGPTWLSVTAGGNATGTPGSVDVGTNTFMVKVMDTGGLSDTATMTVKVNAPTNPPQTVTFTSVAAEDGYATESTETSNIGGSFNATGTAGAGLRIGDSTTKQQIKSVVSFDTSSLPDGAVITSATLKLMRGAISGTPTTLGAIRVDIKGGAGFNNVTTLSKEDFQAAADATGVATMSYPSANGTLSTGVLSATGLTKVNKTGKTQLKVYFATDDDNDNVSDYIGFYPAENATVANRPVLVITYQ